jgi:hypothetical protein
MAEFLAAIYGLIKAVPIVDRWAQQFMEFYYNNEVKKINAAKIEKNEKVSALMAQIKKAESNGERAALLAVLTDIKL